MKTTAAIEDLARVSTMLATVEGSGKRFDPAQYRSLARSVTETLKFAPPGVELDIVLKTFPATAALYENLNYEHAGLCRAPLDASMASEGEAVAAIGRAMKRAQVAENSRG